jgi:intein/homing endonuclease
MSSLVNDMLIQKIQCKEISKCIHPDEYIILKINDKIVFTTIGKFSDSIINKDKLEMLPNKNYLNENNNENNLLKLSSSIYKNLINYKSPKEIEVENVFLSEDVKILTLSIDEKIRWKNIITVSRHKNKKQILHIKTKSGKEIKSHSFLIKDYYGIIGITSKQLKVGDYLPTLPFSKKIFEQDKNNISINFYKNLLENIYKARKCIIDKIPYVGKLFNVITKSIEEYNMNVCLDSNWYKFREVYNKEKQGDFITRDILKKYINELKKYDTANVHIEEFIILETSAFSDVLLDKITSIDKINYNGYVYNFTIEEDETFLVSGIFVHNIK